MRILYKPTTSIRHMQHAVDTLPELAYAGFNHFLKAPASAPDELSPEVDIGVVGVPFDGGSSHRPGARYGPAGIREASSWFAYLGGYKGGLTNVETGRVLDYNDVELRDCGDVPTVPNSVERTRDQVAAFVEMVAESAFPIVLGGDHYITYPSFLGYAETVGSDVGLIHIDAHSDTVESSAIFGEHFHGTPMTRIDESSYGGYENHAMIGIRGYEDPAFYDLVADRDIHVSTAGDVNEQGMAACVEEAVAHATDGVDYVYLTVDIDGIEPAFAPGTGTPEPGGLSSDDLLLAMDMLGECDEIGAMDFMEVAPPLDPTNITSRLAANAIVRFIEAKFL